MPKIQSRRRFLATVTVAGAASFGGLQAAGLAGARESSAAEPPPEVTTIRIEKDPVLCIAPQVVEELLRNEGFADIRYVNMSEAHVRRAEAANLGPVTKMIADGEADFGRDFAPTLVLGLEAGASITILTGLHLGCFEFLAQNDIRKVADLKGKTVGYGVGDKSLLSILANMIGLKSTDIKWYPASLEDPIELFAAGKIDAYLFLPPALQAIHARKIGHVITSQIKDRPWSQYFCCMLATRADFARNYPVATKRAMRAILKGADLCASQPKQIAEMLVRRGYTDRYDYAVEMLNEVRYDVWRDYDPEDSLRFYSLRLHEIGEIKSTPQGIIAKGTNWRFLDELKRELKT